MEDNPQNSEPLTLPSPSSTTPEGASTLYESEELPTFNEFDVFSKVRDDYEKRIIELMNENTLLKEKQNSVSHDDGSKNAYQEEIDCLSQVINELEATNMKQAEKICALEKLREDCQKEKDALETCIAEEPCIIKKLLNYGMHNVWQCYSNESEEPQNIFMNGSDFYTYDVFQKNLLLEGVISQFNADPFIGPAYGQFVQPMMVHNLLERAVSCNVTDLYLHRQTLSWSSYKKLVSSESVQNLFFLDVKIYRDGSIDVYVPLEHVLVKIRNVVNFAHSRSFVTKGTFKSLIKFPVFANLQRCYLNVINYQDFDVNSFLDFIKKYRTTHFKLAFQECNNSMDFDKLQTLKDMLKSRTKKDQIEITK